ncbi:MAG: hypothetical protein DMF89_19110 [Acidobacteria bacterium]|nr:MAG: hypothetical protein DMF90_20190 [Acidobacteriota bacterium]PYR47353.1 MAG: hypothetical protein DMF89_19110 [Acidobacteriota bacterium]
MSAERACEERQCGQEAWLRHRRAEPTISHKRFRAIGFSSIGSVFAFQRARVYPIKTRLLPARFLDADRIHGIAGGFMQVRHVLYEFFAQCARVL